MRFFKLEETLEIKYPNLSKEMGQERCCLASCSQLAAVLKSSSFHPTVLPPPHATSLSIIV